MCLSDLLVCVCVCSVVIGNNDKKPVNASIQVWQYHDSECDTLCYAKRRPCSRVTARDCCARERARRWEHKNTQ